MPSISVSQKKRGRPATGETPRIGVRLPAEVTAALDLYAAKQDPQLSRSDAIRLLVFEGLMRQKLLPPLAEQIKSLYEAYQKRQEKKDSEDPEGAN